MSSPIISKFFIESPRDEYWNTGHGKQIIEVEEQSDDKANRVFLKVLAPQSFASNWPIVSKEYFIECSGPVKDLDYRGYVHLIHSIKPNIPLPKGWKE